MRQGLGTKRERKVSDNVKDGVESFWTVCPYCYCLYEYEIVYLDCCLRCQNCKKAFQAVAIKGPLPKVTVVDGKEQYNVSLALFKICYSYEEAPDVDDKEKKVNVDSKATLGYKTEDLIDFDFDFDFDCDFDFDVDVDAGSNNIQRRRVIANHEGTSGHLNIKEFCEKLQEQLGTNEEDDPAKQESKQSQSSAGGELSNVKMVGTGEKMRGGIGNRRGLMADHLETGLNWESEQEKESKSGELEFYMDDDEIYIGLADL